MWVWSVGQEDPLEKKMVTHSSILTRVVPRTEKPVGLKSMGSQRVGHDWVTEPAHTDTHPNIRVYTLWPRFSHYSFISHIWLLYFPRTYFLYEIILHVCTLSRFSHARLFVTSRLVAHQAPLSVGVSRQGYWSGLPCPPSGDLLDPRI